MTGRDCGAAKSDLHLIELDQPLPGQRRFISCWVSRSDDLTFVVDPGPPATGQVLIRGLDRLGIERLDFILLTHIHLDHAGATAELLQKWPDARVVCHPRGRPHLVHPDRLWEGSLQVLGRTAEVYGRPSPVPQDAVANFDEANGRGGKYEEAVAAGIEVIQTPGHAPHHVCFLNGGRLFSGEAAGTFSTLGRGSDTREYYLRPATPPMFKLEVAISSLDRLLALDPAPRELLFAHHGRFTGDVRGLLQTARDQLFLWVETCREMVSRSGGLPTPGDTGQEIALMDKIAAELARRDEHYARGADHPEDIRIRERDFTRQTLRGMLGYLRTSVNAAG
ncbi:MAG: MBL fold metallo-hydrolase [Gemmatimonadales bacterium]|nr:MBL fold metallo-hydrolase [Gemmatimonadales bacterium]